MLGASKERWSPLTLPQEKMERVRDVEGCCSPRRGGMWGRRRDAGVVGDTLGVRTMFDEVTWDVEDVESLLIDIERAQVQGFVCLAFFSSSV